MLMLSDLVLLLDPSCCLLDVTYDFNAFMLGGRVIITIMHSDVLEKYQNADDDVNFLHKNYKKK